MSVTIRDVAAAAGVSKATVSKVLNNSYTISKETTDRVNEVIREMGYLPNRRAQSFASRSTKTSLFFCAVSTLTEPFCMRRWSPGRPQGCWRNRRCHILL